MTTKYGYEFPDGVVIPVDDPDALKDKLLSMQSFWDRLRQTYLNDGSFLEWYRYDLQRDVENLSEQEMWDIYGVRVIVPKGRGEVRYVLPDGRKVKVQDLFYWMEFEGGYPFSKWYQYVDDGYYQFEDAVEQEAEYMTGPYGSPEYWESYGIRRVPMATGSSNRSGRNPKPKPKQSSQCVKKSITKKPSKTNGSRNTKSGCYPGYSEEYPGGPLVDSYGARLVRCNNCMKLFNEYETSDGPYGDVCPYCGFDGGLMDVTCADLKRASSPCTKRDAAPKKPTPSKCVRKKSTGKTTTKPKASTASKSKKRTSANRR